MNSRRLKQLGWERRVRRAHILANFRSGPPYDETLLCASGRYYRDSLWRSLLKFLRKTTDK